MKFPFFPTLRAGMCIPCQWRLDDFGGQGTLGTTVQFLACSAPVPSGEGYLVTTDADANLAPKYLQTLLPVSLVPFQSRV